MSVDKEILKKLAKVVQNQQKIIHKLAQVQGAEQDITDEINDLIQRTANLPAGVTCANASFLPTSQVVDAKINVQGSQPGNPVNQQIMRVLSAAIAAEKQIPVSNVKVVLLFG